MFSVDGDYKKRRDDRERAMDQLCENLVTAMISSTHMGDVKGLQEIRKSFTRHCTSNVSEIPNPPKDNGRDDRS